MKLFQNDWVENNFVNFKLNKVKRCKLRFILVVKNAELEGICPGIACPQFLRVSIDMENYGSQKVQWC